MGSWAEVIDGVVVNVVVADSEWVQQQSSPEKWVEYFDANPAKITGIYRDGIFYPPQPFASWTLDEDGDWMPPVPYPTDVYDDWQWNESTLSWTPLYTNP
jgi:hypothetical protein